MAKQKEEKAPHPMDSIIENIKTDQVLLSEKETLITQAKADKHDVQQRLKSYRKDLSVFLKYASEEQKQEVESLGFTSEETASGINEVAQITLDIMNQKKEMTNDELYNEYAKSISEKGETPIKYTAFNIKIRGLFNRQHIKRNKGKDGTSSREDIIRFNGNDN